MSRTYGLVGGNIVVVAAVLVAVAGEPRASGAVLVLSPSWLGYRSAVHVVAGADGSIVAVNASNTAAIGVSADPRFVEKLYGAGALLVWRAPGLSACMTHPRSRGQS